MKQFADDVLDKKGPYTKTVCGLFLTPTSYDARADCGSATHGTIRRHHSLVQNMPRQDFVMKISEMFSELQGGLKCS